MPVHTRTTCFCILQKVATTTTKTATTEILITLCLTNLKNQAVKNVNICWRLAFKLWKHCISSKLFFITQILKSNGFLFNSNGASCVLCAANINLWTLNLKRLFRHFQVRYKKLLSVLILAALVWFLCFIFVFCSTNWWAKG